MLNLGDQLAGSVGDKMVRTGNLNQGSFYLPEFEGMIQLLSFGWGSPEIIHTDHYQGGSIHIGNQGNG